MIHYSMSKQWKEKALNLDSQYEYAQVYDKRDVKYTKLAKRFEEVLTEYINETKDLDALKADNNWIYIAGCKFNANKTTVNIHIGSSQKCTEIVQFFAKNHKKIAFFCAKKLGKTYSMPNLNFHENHLIDEILELDQLQTKFEVETETT